MKIILDCNAKVARENVLHRQLGMMVYIRIVMIMRLEYELCHIKISGC
jgi:hypothetical protein